MPAVQTTYKNRIDPAYAGQPASLQNRDQIDALRVETSAGIGFGLAVFRGAADRSCILGSASSVIADWVGLTVRRMTEAPFNSSDDGDKYIPKEQAATVAYGGDFWVEVDGAVSDGDDVTITPATGRLGTKAVASGIILLPNAVWLDSQSTDGGLAKVRLPGHLRP